MATRLALVIAGLTTSGCINYAVATGDESHRTVGGFAAVELSASAVAALVPFQLDRGKPLSYPLRFLVIVASTIMIDASVMMLWRAE